MQQIFKPAFEFISFTVDTFVHFAARQEDTYGAREFAIYTIDDQIYFTLATGVDNLVDEECPTLAHAYEHLRRNMNVPLHA